MSLNSRTPDQIQNTYLQALALVNSGLVVDTNIGSLAYTLSRATAAICIQQDNRLLELQNSSVLLNARGITLDNLLSGVLTRVPASYATGSVLAITKTGSQTILTGATLIELSSGLQYKVTSGSTPIYNLVEGALQVTALSAGAGSNLTAGTALFAPNYPNVCFHVGATHTDTYYGDLLGGVEAESDASLLQRFLQRMSNGATASSPNLLSQLLSYPLVDRAYVNTTVPGIVEIWVDSPSTYSKSQLTELLNYIKPYLAAGVMPVILQASRLPVNLNIAVTPFSSSSQDLNTLATKLTSVLANYINSLGLGQGLSLAAVVSLLSPLALSVSIASPTGNISCGASQILVLGNISYTFPY